MIASQVLNTFNTMYRQTQNQDLLRKSLTSAAGQGEALIPQQLEKVITNTIIRLVPELSIPTIQGGTSKFWEFNRLTAIPKAGSAMGEASVTPTRNSSFGRFFEQMKIMKRKGAVTGFLQATSRSYTNASTQEYEAHLQSFGYDLRTYLFFGNAGADQYTFTGLDKFVSSNRFNLTGAAKIPVSLDILDQMIDANTRAGGQNHRKVFLMSPELLSAFSQLWTQVRDNRSANREGSGTTDIQDGVSGGYRLQSYRGVPILETTATRPLVQMGVVTLGAAGAGAAIPDATYYFRVAPVTWDGEQGASTASNSITTTGNDTITLSFTPVENAIYYKVYAATTDGGEKLVNEVSAFTYDSNGTVTGDTSSIVFSSDPTVPDSNVVPSSMQDDLPLEYSATSPDEYLALWDIDEIQGLGTFGYTNENGTDMQGLITHMEIARTDDNFPFLMKSYSGLIPSFEKTSSIVRGIKTGA
jgi:hypothetical protein